MNKWKRFKHLFCGFLAHGAAIYFCFDPPKLHSSRCGTFAESFGPLGSDGAECVPAIINHRQGSYPQQLLEEDKIRCSDGCNFLTDINQVRWIQLL